MQSTNPTPAKGLFNQSVYSARDRIYSDLSRFVAVHGYCLLGGSVLAWGLSEWTFTRDWVFEGTLIGTVAMVVANTFFSPYYPHPQSAGPSFEFDSGATNGS